MSVVLITIGWLFRLHTEKKGRDADLRREIYIKAVESTQATFGFFAAAADLRYGNDQLNGMQKQAGISALTAVYLVADAEVAVAASKFRQVYNSAVQDALFKRTQIWNKYAAQIHSANPRKEVKQAFFDYMRYVLDITDKVSDAHRHLIDAMRGELKVSKSALEFRPELLDIHAAMRKDVEGHLTALMNETSSHSAQE